MPKLSELSKITTLDPEDLLLRVGELQGGARQLKAMNSGFRSRVGVHFSGVSQAVLAATLTEINWSSAVEEWRVGDFYPDSVGAPTDIVVPTGFGGLYFIILRSAQSGSTSQYNDTWINVNDVSLAAERDASKAADNTFGDWHCQRAVVLEDGDVINGLVRCNNARTLVGIQIIVYRLHEYSE